MFRHNTLLAVALSVAVITGANAGLGRDYLHMVGSTTVYPFSSMVVEQFVKTSGFKTPMLQATGSGGGIMLFCLGVGVLDPDITYASRRIRKSEFDNCQKNGVAEVVEVKIGYDGIVIASSKKAQALHLTRRDIFLALAKEVPDPKGGETLVANPYKTWKDVNDTLPAQPIKVLGPARGSGTGHVFARFAMEGGCRTFGWIRASKKEDALQYKTTCRTVRQDGAYVEASEADALTVQKLVSEPDTLGIFSFGVLDQNSDKIHGSVINGVKPDFETIADDSYPLSRLLYLYVKKAHVDVYPGIREFLEEFTSDRAWGSGGYLTERGLVPMSAEERRKFAADAKNLAPMSM